MLNNFTFRKNLCVLLLMIFALAFPKLNAQDAYCVKADFTFIETESGQVAFVGSTDIPVIEWYWYFGDQDESREQNPSHIYDFAGEYDVCLKVLANESCTGSVCKKIRVNTGALSGACNLFVDFKHELQGNYLVARGVSLANNSARYFWDFGDGEKGEGSEVKHLYPADGEYEICLTVEQQPTTANGEVCTETICKSVIIGTTNNPCQIDADFKFDLTGNQLYALAVSNAGNTATYEWKISDGTALNGPEIKHEFTERGDYEICLVVTRLATTVNQSCSATVCKKVSVGESVSSECDLEADFIFVRSNTGTSVQAKSNDPNADFYWTIEGMNVSLTGPEVRLPITGSGTYTICLTVSSREFDCRDQICKRISINRSSVLAGPNPVTDIIHLNNEELAISNYSIVSSTSGLMTTQNISGHSATIDVSHLSTGMYLITIEYEDGSRSTEKIFKQ